MSEATRKREITKIVSLGKVDFEDMCKDTCIYTSTLNLILKLFEPVSYVTG